MSTIRRIPVLWGGIAGMPGYSLFYAAGASTATAELLAFFNAVKALFPTGLQWTVPIVGDTLDDTTGALNGQWTDAGGGIVSATASGAYAAGTGAWVGWKTAAIVGGRRLQGRTFMCPLQSTVGYDSSGTILSAAITTMSGAASTLAASGKLVVWHRPPPGGNTGSSAAITAGVVPDQVTSLRSRRY